MLKSIHLTLLIGPTIPLPAPREVIEALTGVQVTIGSGQAGGFQLSFSLSKKSLLNRVLIPAGYFDPKIRVIIMVTFKGIPHVLMDGVITNQEVSASNEPGQSTLSVTGSDLTVLMGLEEKKLPYPAFPTVAQINVIIAQYAIFGMIPLVIPPIVVDVETALQRWDTQVNTDLEFIEEAASQAGYVFYLDAGPLPGANIAYFGPEVRVGIPQRALNINMDAETNTESLSFSLDGLSRKQPRLLVQIPFTKLSIPIPVPEINLLKPPLALRSAPALKTEDIKDVAKLNPIKATLRGLAKASESSDAVTCSGQLDVLRYGRILKARQLVGVRGAGLAYDGFYYVKSVTHDLKPGEYKQSFNLVRNGLISITPRVLP